VGVEADGGTDIDFALGDHQPMKRGVDCHRCHGQGQTAPDVMCLECNGECTEMIKENTVTPIDDITPEIIETLRTVTFSISTRF
jgi:DnaJ-class molecular chaperone